MTQTHENALQLLTAKDLGKMMRLSKRQIFRLNTSGRLPAPVRIGGAVRWSAQEISRWISAGGPDRKTWEQIRGPKNEVEKGDTTDLDAAKLVANNRNREEAYRNALPTPSDLQDQIGFLLWRLQGKLSWRERREGYHRLKVLLWRKYGGGMQ